jgi:uncharacterized membrane protein
MNPVAVHLMLNHFPVVTTVCGFIVLVGGYLYKNPSIKRTGLVLFVFTGLMSIPVYLSGQRAAEVAKNIGVIDPATIAEHAEVAAFYFPMLLALGALSLITLFIDKINSRIAPGFYYFVILLALTAIMTSYRVATLGGAIRHPEGV